MYFTWAGYAAEGVHLVYKLQRSWKSKALHHLQLVQCSMYSFCSITSLSKIHPRLQPLCWMNSFRCIASTCFIQSSKLYRLYSVPTVYWLCTYAAEDVHTLYNLQRLWSQGLFYMSWLCCKGCIFIPFAGHALFLCNVITKTHIHRIYLQFSTIRRINPILCVECTCCVFLSPLFYAACI